MNDNTPNPLGRVKLPSAEDLGAWIDELGCITAELVQIDDAPRPPAHGSEAATVRALKLQDMRLWLTGALHIRVHADAGQHVGDDPDALPICSTAAGH